MLDEAFKNELDKLIPGIKRDLFGNEIEEDYDDCVSEYRPTFTTQEATTFDEYTDVLHNNENISTKNIGVEFPEEKESLQPSRSEDTDTQTTPVQSADDIELVDNTTTSQTEPQTRLINDNCNAYGSTNQMSHTCNSTPKSWQPHERQSHSDSIYDKEPKEWTTDDIERIKAKGVARCLSEGDAEPIEIEQLNTLLGSNMSAEEIADTNYLAQMRLYQNLKDHGEVPAENIEEFVKSRKKEHNLASGKYIHKCSAKYGIVYISPSIWNKVASGRCIICVYLGKRAKDFMYLRSIDDILKWVHEDDILIKLTGEKKVDVVNTLYNGVLNGVTGTAYTMIRVASNAIYNPVFAQLMDNPDQEDSVDEF